MIRCKDTGYVIGDTQVNHTKGDQCKLHERDRLKLLMFWLQKVVINANLCTLIIMSIVFTYVLGDKYFEDDNNTYCSMFLTFTILVPWCLLFLWLLF